MSKPSLSDFMAVTSPEPTQKPDRQVKSGDQIINMTIRLPHSRWKKLADLSTDERKSIQAIVVQALEAEFSRRGLTL
jgi:hypothetical protein